MVQLMVADLMKQVQQICVVGCGFEMAPQHSVYTGLQYDAIIDCNCPNLHIVLLQPHGMYMACCLMPCMHSQLPPFVLDGHATDAWSQMGLSIAIPLLTAQQQCNEGPAPKHRHRH